VGTCAVLGFPGGYGGWKGVGGWYAGITLVRRRNERVLSSMLGTPTRKSETARLCVSEEADRRNNNKATLTRGWCCDGERVEVTGYGERCACYSLKRHAKIKHRSTLSKNPLSNCCQLLPPNAKIKTLQLLQKHPLPLPLPLPSHLSYSG
jgi:hypothetical protein